MKDDYEAAYCPFDHQMGDHPTLMARVTIEPGTYLNRPVLAKLAPDGLHHYWSYSPRLAGITPVPGSLWIIQCRHNGDHVIPPMRVHWIGGINDGNDP